MSKLTQHVFRLDRGTDLDLAALAAELRTSEVDVVRRAIRELAKRELPNGQQKTSKKKKTAP